MINTYQRAASDVVERYDGHVANYMGDGILVYFGYPHAHGDDAERACRAGLGLVATVEALGARLVASGGPNLAIRVGIHTGEVVVGEAGSSMRHETQALGNTMNVASRVEENAGPNQVVVTDATLDLVQGVFETQDLGEMALSGLANPMRLHRMLRPTGMRSRLEMAGARLTSFVGRDQELGLLLDRWDQAKAGKGQAVIIQGDAGIGKSRLVEAMRERLREDRHSWLECRCSPYHLNTPLHPVIELLRFLLRFSPEGDTEDQRNDLRLALELAGLDPPETLPLLADLLSLPVPEKLHALELSPDSRRRRTIELLSSWLLALSDHQPLVVVVDDLQWSDPTSSELLEKVIDQLPTTPVMLLVTTRPPLTVTWTSRSHVLDLTLGPLTEPQIQAMIATISGTDAVPSQVLDQLVVKTDGVPLFVEELTKTVLESGLVTRVGDRLERTDPLPDLSIPASLQDTLMARLDRLESGKLVAQLGAVLGREFTFVQLEAVSPLDPGELEEALAKLVEAELLYVWGAPPSASYTFKHALVQNQAYESLLRRTRRELHEQIAESLEDHSASGGEVDHEVIARHYESAGRAEKAILYYNTAAEAAARRLANAEAVGLLTRALELLAELPRDADRDERELEVQTLLAAPLVVLKGWAGPEAGQLFERSVELCEAVGSSRQLARALLGLHGVHNARGELDTAAALAQRSLELADVEDDSSLTVVANYSAGITAYAQGKLTESLDYFDESISALDPSQPDLYWSIDSTEDPAIVSRIWSAWGLWLRGYPDRALERNEQAIDLAQQGGHLYSVAYALAWAASIHLMRRERDPARKRANQAMEIAEAQEFVIPLLVGRLTHAWACSAEESIHGDVAATLDEFERSFTELATGGTQFAAPLVLGSLATVYHELGRNEEAIGYVDLGLDISQQTGQPFWDAELLRTQAEAILAMDPGQHIDAERLLKAALDIAENQKARSLELRCATSLAKLWQQQARYGEARQVLQPVFSWFTEGYDTCDLSDAKAVLDGLD